MFYAIYKGKKTGITENKEEFLQATIGFKGVAARKFKTKEEAETWLNMQRGCAVPKPKEPQIIPTPQGYTVTKPTSKQSEPISKEPKSKPPFRNGILVAYTDGSYNLETNEYSYGAVYLFGEEVDYQFGKNKNTFLPETNGIGEMLGAIQAMNHAVINGFDTLILFCDFNQIPQICRGEVQVKNGMRQRLRQVYLNANEKIDIVFGSVKAHSGDKYNNKADELAGLALK